MSLLPNEAVGSFFDVSLMRTKLYKGKVDSVFNYKQDSFLVPLVESSGEDRDKSKDATYSEEHVRFLEAQAVEEQIHSGIGCIEDFITSLGVKLPSSVKVEVQADHVKRDFVDTTVSIEALPPVLVFVFNIFGSDNVRILLRMFLLLFCLVTLN